MLSQTDNRAADNLIADLWHAPPTDSFQAEDYLKKLSQYGPIFVQFADFIETVLGNIGVEDGGEQAELIVAAIARLGAVIEAVGECQSHSNNVFGGYLRLCEGFGCLVLSEPAPSKSRAKATITRCDLGAPRDESVEQILSLAFDEYFAAECDADNTCVQLVWNDNEYWIYRSAQEADVLTGFGVEAEVMT